MNAEKGIEMDDLKRSLKIMAAVLFLPVITLIINIIYTLFTK
jgi:hypothetical protein